MRKFFIFLLAFIFYMIGLVCKEFGNYSNWIGFICQMGFILLIGVPALTWWWNYIEKVFKNG